MSMGSRYFFGGCSPPTGWEGGEEKEPDPARRMGVNLTKIAQFFLTVPELRLQPIFSPLREDRLKP